MLSWPYENRLKTCRQKKYILLPCHTPNNTCSDELWPMIKCRHRLAMGARQGALPLDKLYTAFHLRHKLRRTSSGARCLTLVTVDGMSLTLLNPESQITTLYHIPSFIHVSQLEHERYY
ncbi:hypothetical protein O181_079169 [Austropuccinia psidii MF-1]|uniref:Uncharacterized protein n=1 Tax=Austropuccinia psidii MF-1 TaxID=1389203 RepID=A0A9Q3II00_9BASI|nr:hypothetical protein [Austropuccinia psidii MF-1]